MIIYWTTILNIFIMSDKVKGWNSSDITSPPNFKLQALDMWRLKIEWNINKNKQRIQVYEIQVGRTTNMDIIYSVNVSRGLHAVIWSSQLPLNCVNHAVRIRLITAASTFSSWSPWKTNYGEVSSDEILLFPDDQVLREGSTVMFCCVYPRDTSHISSMFLGNTAYKVINISPRVKAIRVDNLKATNTYGVNFYCDMTSDVAYNFVTFPPEKPQHFRCETADMRNIHCSWEILRAPNLNGSYRRTYTLLISDSRTVSCNFNPPSCGFKVVPHQITYNVTLLVRNSLGRESESDIFNITDRVFPMPQRLEATAGVFDSLVILHLNGSFSGLQLICQIELEPGGTVQELVQDGSDSVQLYLFRLQNLKPSTQFASRGRCAVQGKHWSHWTAQQLFITEPLVTVELWRQIKKHPNRNITLLWKPVSSDPQLYIEAYEVCVSSINPQRSVCMNVTQTQVELNADLHMYDVTVQAVIRTGLSVPSHITIPSAYTEEKAIFASHSVVKRIMGNDEGFQLTWTRDSGATCDYVVEWCILGIEPPCNLQWRKVPTNQTYLQLNAGDFTAGVQYMFKIYGCGADGPRLHEKQTGYLKELRPKQYPTLLSHPDITCSSVNLTWRFNEQDPKHPGFITGYVIRVRSESGSELLSFSESVNDPHSKSLTVSGLQENQPYTFHLAACTSAGCGPESRATFRTRQNYYLLMVKIGVPLLVLLGCCVCLWSYRNIIKGFLEESFSFLHIKAPDLDEDLYKASEKIRRLQIEDCKWCDVEILDIRHTALEKTYLSDAEDQNCALISPEITLSSLIKTSHHLNTDIWTNTGLTNFTYVSSAQPNSLKSKQLTEISSDYVTSVATYAKHGEANQS
ncbi:leukemia inhibitory factor receptor [Danio rerio]|uniref:Leukemia inhibitory factor receptor n=1 Tax=Danio rerio TaxID=7955 RepID=A0AC58JNH7_DANRE